MCLWVLWPLLRAHSPSQRSRGVSNTHESRGASAETVCPAQVPTQHVSLHSPKGPRGQRQTRLNPPSQGLNCQQHKPKGVTAKQGEVLSSQAVTETSYHRQ